MQSYCLLRKIGKKKEAHDVKQKIKEMKLHRLHLALVMNLDFDKPSERMKKMAKEANIDLSDSSCIE